jgi:hypothetical protein
MLFVLLKVFHVFSLDSSRIRATGTDASKDGGEDLVRYRTFLDIIRISRNRKMAALSRAKELTRRGLKRWQQNSLVCI